MPTTKKQIAAVLTEDEHAAVTERAQAAKLTIGNWLRIKIGLLPLKQGRPVGNKDGEKKQQKTK